MFIQFLNLLATIISVISLLIVTYGALIAFIAFTINELKRFTGKYTSINIRRLRATFGTYLLLGLEFLIASDILKTVLEPTLNELAILGGIVVLRTVLSVFLRVQLKIESQKQEVLPGQQIAVYSKVTKKEVQEVVKELNPDLNSLGSRG